MSSIFFLQTVDDLALHVLLWFEVTNLLFTELGDVQVAGLL